MAMPVIEFHISLFSPETGGLSRGRSQRCVLWLMESLIRVNEMLLSQYRNEIPPIYDAGVVYKREESQEHWQDIRHVQASGSGDCEDLSCWRSAELRYMGIQAGPYITWRRSPKGWIYHALVRWPDGRIEDPSLALGMRGPAVHKPVFIRA